MRSIWNGAISFGLVSIPIKLVNATENHSVSFRQIHTADGGRIRYRKVCELEEKEIPAAEIGKGYEEADGSIIPITDEDLAALPLPTAKTIEIVAFVPASSIDPLQMDAAYYLSADGTPAAKPYTLLREALRRSEKVALAKFALRGRERLGMLRVVDDVIAMHGLLWPDEIRSPQGVAPETEVSVRDAELDLADALMDTLGSVDMDSLHDDYREAVESMIASKAEGGGALPAAAGAEEGGGRVIDLMAALENSVKAAKAARSGRERPEGEVAEVTQLAARGRTGGGGAGSRAKAASGKKSAGSAGSATARKSAAPAGKTAGGKKSTAGSGSGSGSGGAAKKSAAKGAAGSASAKTSARASGTSGTSGKKEAKTAKAAPRKRASA